MFRKSTKSYLKKLREVIKGNWDWKLVEVKKGRGVCGSYEGKVGGIGVQ